MKTKIKAVIVAIFLLVCGVVSANDLSLRITNDGYVEAKITLNPNGQDENHRRRLATIDAYRYIAEHIGDLQVTSESKVEDFILKSDNIKLIIQKTISGLEIIDNYPDPVSDSWHSTVRLKIYGKNSLASAILAEESTEVEDFLKPKFTPIIDKDYTGLIVDCRGWNLTEAIFPSIISEDDEMIYSYKNVKRNVAASNGLMGYSESVDSDVMRAGSKPLIVKALRTSDCDVVVSDEDKDKILTANQTSKFLNNCMVVFVR